MHPLTLNAPSWLFIIVGIVGLAGAYWAAWSRSKRDG